VVNCRATLHNNNLKSFSLECDHKLKILGRGPSTSFPRSALVSLTRLFTQPLRVDKGLEIFPVTVSSISPRNRGEQYLICITYETVWLILQERNCGETRE